MFFIQCFLNLKESIKEKYEEFLEIIQRGRLLDRHVRKLLCIIVKKKKNPSTLLNVCAGIYKQESYCCSPQELEEFIH